MVRDTSQIKIVGYHFFFFFFSFFFLFHDMLSAWPTGISFVTSIGWSKYKSISMEDAN